MKQRPHLPLTVVLGALTVLALGPLLAACGSGNDGDAGSEQGESGPVDEDISVPISEQDLDLARHIFDTGRERWDSFDPFAHTMTVGFETISEVRISFDAAGNVVSEEVVTGDPTESSVKSLPRSVDEVFDEVDDLILAFEDGRSRVPDEGECGHHFNAVFDSDWGVPERYSTLGPCDDGVGIVVSITRDVAADDRSASEPVLEAEGDALEATWQEFVDDSRSLDQVDPPAVAGFEPFNQALLLPDGRYLARGQWDGDEPIARWQARNPNSVAPGEELPEPIDRSDPPIRLFLFDVDGELIAPISHVPIVRPYSTATSSGEVPDVVLGFALLGDEQTVAYTSGFSGAAYDIPYELYTVDLPPA